jgi:hypothetical protein
MAIELASAVRKPAPPKVKDNVMSDEEPIDSILAEDAMEKNRDYVLRGRRFRDVDTDILRQRWTETFKIWAADLANQEVLRENNDAEAELRLRQIEPPYETVKAETERLAATIPLKEKDPEGWANVRQAIGDILAKRQDDTHH